MKLELYIIISALILFPLSCQRNDRISAPSPSIQSTGRIAISFAKVPAGITDIVATLSRNGYDSLMLHLTVSDSGQSASGTFQNISSGVWNLKVRAMDQNNIVLFTGETDVTVLTGETVSADLELEPPATGNLEIHVTWGNGNTPDFTRGLVAYYPFNGNANDESGNGNTGILSGGVTSTSDRFGNLNKAYRFNGIDGYIRVEKSTSLLFYSGISISAWFKPLEFAKAQDMVSQWTDNSGSDRGYALDVGNQVVSSNILSNSNLLCYSVPNDTNRWYSVVATWDGSVLSLYLDSVQVASKPTTGTFTNQDTPLGIGADLSASALSFFHGTLDDIRIYNRALSNLEIQQIYHEGGW